MARKGKAITVGVSPEAVQKFVSMARATDGVRPVLESVYAVGEYVFAADGYRLHCVQFASAEERRAVVPDTEDPSFNWKLALDRGNFTAGRVRVHRKELIRLIDVAASMADRHGEIDLIWHADTSILSVVGMGWNGDSSGWLPAALPAAGSRDWQAAFTHKLLRDALRALSSDFVFLRMEGDSVAIEDDAGGAQWLALVMRLHAGSADTSAYDAKRKEAARLAADGRPGYPVNPDRHEYGADLSRVRQDKPRKAHPSQMMPGPSFPAFPRRLDVDYGKRIRLAGMLLGARVDRHNGMIRSSDMARYNRLIGYALRYMRNGGMLHTSLVSLLEDGERLGREWKIRNTTGKQADYAIDRIELACMLIDILGTRCQAALEFERKGMQGAAYEVELLRARMARINRLYLRLRGSLPTIYYADVRDAESRGRIRGAHAVTDEDARVWVERLIARRDQSHYLASAGKLRMLGMVVGRLQMWIDHHDYNGDPARDLVARRDRLEARARWYGSQESEYANRVYFDGHRAGYNAGLAMMEAGRTIKRAPAVVDTAADHPAPALPADPETEEIPRASYPDQMSALHGAIVRVKLTGDRQSWGGQTAHIAYEDGFEDALTSAFWQQAGILELLRPLGDMSPEDAAQWHAVPIASAIPADPAPVDTSDPGRHVIHSTAETETALYRGRDGYCTAVLRESIVSPLADPAPADPGARAYAYGMARGRLAAAYADTNRGDWDCIVDYKRLKRRVTRIEAAIAKIDSRYPGRADIGAQYRNGMRDGQSRMLRFFPLKRRYPAKYCYAPALRIPGSVRFLRAHAVYHRARARVRPTFTLSGRIDRVLSSTLIHRPRAFCALVVRMVYKLRSARAIAAGQVVAILADRAPADPAPVLVGAVGVVGVVGAHAAPALPAVDIPADPAPAIVDPAPAPALAGAGDKPADVRAPADPINVDTFASAINALTFDDLARLMGDKIAAVALAKVRARMLEIGKELRAAEAIILRDIEEARAIPAAPAPAVDPAPALVGAADADYLPLAIPADLASEEEAAGPDWSAWGALLEDAPAPALEDTQPMRPINEDTLDDPDPEDDPPAGTGADQGDKPADVRAPAQIITHIRGGFDGVHYEVKDSNGAVYTVTRESFNRLRYGAIGPNDRFSDFCEFWPAIHLTEPIASAVQPTDDPPAQVATSSPAQTGNSPAAGISSEGVGGSPAQVGAPARIIPYVSEFGHDGWQAVHAETGDALSWSYTGTNHTRQVVRSIVCGTYEAARAKAVRGGYVVVDDKPADVSTEAINPDTLGESSGTVINAPTFDALVRAITGERAHAQNYRLGLANINRQVDSPGVQERRSGIEAQIRQADNAAEQMLSELPPELAEAVRHHCDVWDEMMVASGRVEAWVEHFRGIAVWYRLGGAEGVKEALARFDVKADYKRMADEIRALRPYVERADQSRAELIRLGVSDDDDTLASPWRALAGWGDYLRAGRAELRQYLGVKIRADKAESYAVKGW